MSSRRAIRYQLSITPGDTGRRVSVRRRVTGGKFTDVVGELESWTDGILRVRRRDGSLVTVPEDSLVAGKVVPSPRAPRRRREP